MFTRILYFHFISIIKKRGAILSSIFSNFFSSQGMVPNTSRLTTKNAMILLGLAVIMVAVLANAQESLDVADIEVTKEDILMARTNKDMCPAEGFFQLICSCGSMILDKTPYNIAISLDEIGVERSNFPVCMKLCPGYPNG